MDFPEELGEDPKERREFREEWFEIAEDELVAEDEISSSDAGDGSDPESDPDDEALDDLDDEMMHEEDVFGDGDLLDEDDALR